MISYKQSRTIRLTCHKTSIHQFLGGLLPVFNKDKEKGLVDKNIGRYLFSGNLNGNNLKVLSVNDIYAHTCKFIINIGKTIAEVIIRIQNKVFSSQTFTCNTKDKFTFIMKNGVLYIRATENSMFSLSFIPISGGTAINLILEITDDDISSPDDQFSV